jgi:hypothetical protein
LQRQQQTLESYEVQMAQRLVFLVE